MGNGLGRRALFVSLLGVFQALSAWGFSDLKSELEAFHADPASWMDKTPEKEGTSGVVRLRGDSGREFVRRKDIWRKRFFEAQPGGVEALELIPLSEPGWNDQVETLLGHQPEVTTLDDMESRGLREATLPVQPWSDNYWPIYAGGLGHRYGDPSWPGELDWMKNFKHVEANPAIGLFRRAGEFLNRLSPSEKYDLLAGESFSLTNSMWEEGRYYYDKDGKVESWMGYCHGWAAAAYVLARPAKTARGVSHDGHTTITFYPSDLKALATLLWAKSPPRVRFIGGRCNLKFPEEDENGRVKDPQCRDTNPATWHLAVVNSIGEEKRSFVLDATYDYEVWNQPIASYHYEFFNPQTLEPGVPLDRAGVTPGEFARDKFKAYRSPETKRIVGVSMELTYVSEVPPVQAETDAPDRDSLITVRYVYDLELDSEGRIVGGEWYTNQHPDFLWTPPAGSKAMAYEDWYLSDEAPWSGTESLPELWQKLSVQAAGRGVPLASIVDSLWKQTEQ